MARTCSLGWALVRQERPLAVAAVLFSRLARLLVMRLLPRRVQPLQALGPKVALQVALLALQQLEPPGQVWLARWGWRFGPRLVAWLLAQARPGSCRFA